jgi:hypothetical protein
MGVQKAIMDAVIRELKKAELPEIPPISQYIESTLLGLGCYFSVREIPDTIGLFHENFIEYGIALSTAFGLSEAAAVSFFFYSLNAYCNNTRHRRKTPDSKTDEMCEIEGCDVLGEEWDHILPNAWGGSNHEWNLQWLCKSHNRVKSSSLHSFSYRVVKDNNYRTEFQEWVRQGYPPD